MRNWKAFFSFAVAAAALLAATAVLASGHRDGPGPMNVPTPAPSPPPTSCSTSLFDARVSSGPTFVACSAPGGQCTQIEYEVNPARLRGTKTRQVFVLEGVGVWDVLPKGARWFAPCEGIPLEHESGFGTDACHEQAVAVDIGQGVTRFTVVLAGLRHSSSTSVAGRRGERGEDDDLEACTILGLGLEGGPDAFQTTLRTETIDFKGCEVEFTRDPVTGEVQNARLLTETSDSGEPCQSPTLRDDGTIDPRPATDVEVSVGGVDLGMGRFGDGYVSTGKESCTTRVIGGRVYTWGAPCP